MNMNNNDSNSSTNRRDFIRTLGVLGAGITAVGTMPSAEAAQISTRPSSSRYMGDFAAPKLEKVRWGAIGVGARGSGHVSQLSQIEGSEVVAICDLHQPYLDFADDKPLGMRREQKLHDA